MTQELSPPLIWNLCHFSLNIDSAIIWGICSLNAFKGSVFWVSYLGAAVLLMFMWFPFRPFDLLGGFSNRFTIAVMFGAISSTFLNMFLKPKIEFFKCLTQLDGCRVSGHTWWPDFELMKCSLLLLLFLVFLMVKNQLNTGTTSWLGCHRAVLVYKQILTWLNGI